MTGGDPAALMDALGAWFHPLTALLVALDAPIPPVPSEVVVIGSGAVSYTHLTLPTKRIV